MTSIHLQSDVHTESGSYLDPICASDIAICAGDIGTLIQASNLETYFKKLLDTTDHVIYILGNHEFYHCDYNQALDIANNLASKLGIHVLDEALGTENLEINGIKFWGSTLWTDLKNNDWFVKQKVGNGFNDFYVISNGINSFTAQDTLDINKRTRDKINWEADIIITHHSPIVREHSRFPINDITYGFCNTGLEDQILNSKVKYWLFGHTHDSIYVDLNGTHVVSNQHGYARSHWQTGELLHEDCGFDPNLILRI